MVRGSEASLVCMGRPCLKISEIIFKRKVSVHIKGAEKWLCEWVRSLAAVAKGLGLVSSIHMVTHNHL